MSNLILKLGLKFQTISIIVRLLITIGLLILFYIIKNGTFSFIDKSNLTSKPAIKYKKVISFICKLIFIILIIPIWIFESKDILTFIGLFSAGLAFAFRDVMASFLGWIIINTKKPFKAGDRIKIGQSLGDVIEIDWFYTTIIEVTENRNNNYGQSTGRFIYIPNIKLLTEELVNETNSFPYTWNELKICLSINSNWEKAKEIILKIADNKVGHIEKEAKDSLNIACKQFPIHYQNLSHTVYTSIEDGKIILTLRFICKARNFRNLEHIIIENILIEFSKHTDIQLS